MCHLIVAGISSDVDDIDTAVLTGLLAGQKINFEKMKLSLLYDRADYAKSHIFSKGLSVENEHLVDLMVLALKRGDHNYVKLLMDYGVNMHQVSLIIVIGR